MASIDEIVSLEEDLKKAKWAALEGRSKVRKATEAIASSEKRLVGVEKNLEACVVALGKLRAADVVALFTETGEKGEYIKYRNLVDQNEELIQRIKIEICNLKGQIKEAQDNLPSLDQAVKRVEKQLSQYGVVKEFKRG